MALSLWVLRVRGGGLEGKGKGSGRGTVVASGVEMGKEKGNG